ncbi:MAG: peptidoglycan DD-metalloendopeptidase family protein, partial [Chloroflexi bacterium]|nr:peptidoglycan DD-metalloendopeptidase family protein [Chloroflexota bacterium]
MITPDMAAIRAAVPVAPLVQAAAVVADPAEPPPSQAAALAENAGRIGAAAEQPLALNVNAQPDEDAVALLETQWAAPTAPSQMQNVNAQAEQDAVALLETVWATPIAPALMVYGPFDVAAPFDPLAAISDEAAAAGQGRSMFALMSITLSSVDYATLSAEWSWLMSVTSKADAAQLWTGPFQLPVAGVVTSPFGEVRDDEGVPHTPHLGVDLGAPTGTPVHAANDGVVIFVGPLAVRGNAVIINHGAGVFSGYYHLSRIDVAAGQTIRSGELVGAVGAIGLATGPHLHWDMIVRGTHTDSLTWVGQTAIPDPKQLGGAVTGSVPQIAKAPNYPTPAPQP